MTQYLLAVHRGEDTAPTDGAPVDAFDRRLRAAGRWVFGGALAAPETGTLVRIGADDEVAYVDAPHADDRVGGFWVVEADDLDDVLRLAEAGARACGGPVEVRPFQSA